MNNFLLLLAGARREIIELCPTERAKFQSVGMTILITSAMATMSMWFALSSAMGINQIASLPAALLWGLIIMGIDRWFVTSLPIDGRRRLLIVFPRLAMALLLGSVISTPIVLRVFQPEINAEISVIKEQRFSAFITGQQYGQMGKQVIYWGKDVSNLQKVIDSGGQVALDPSADPMIQSLTKKRAAKQSQEHQYYQQWQCQLHGGTRCTVKGNPSLAQANEGSYNETAAQVAALTVQIQQREQQLSAIDVASKRARYQEAQSSLSAAKRQLSTAQAQQDELSRSFGTLNQATNGILIRLQALDQLTQKDFTLTTALYLLFLLFLVIDCLPVTVKLLQGPGIYEEILKANAVRELREAQAAYLSRSMAKPGTMTVAQIWTTVPAGPDPAYVSHDDLHHLWKPSAQEAAGLIAAPPELLLEKAPFDNLQEYVPPGKVRLREIGGSRTRFPSTQPDTDPQRHASSIDLRYSDDDL